MNLNKLIFLFTPLAAMTLAVMACDSAEFKSGPARSLADKSKDSGEKKHRSEAEPDDDDGFDDGEDPESIITKTSETSDTPETGETVETSVAENPGPKLTEDSLTYEGTPPELVEGDGTYKLCSKDTELPIAVIADANLQVNSGYAPSPGTATFDMPTYIHRAKGYITRLSQDDAGAFVDINGTRVLEMKNAHYAAGNWFFNGLTKAQSYADSHPDTIAWLNSIGGAGNAADLVVQGFPIKPGSNTISGNARDIYGAYRSLGVQLRIRSLVPVGQGCP